MINKVILIGNLGKDPELSDANGTPVVNTTLATSESWKDRDGNKQTDTQWHNLSFWGRSAEVVAQYAKKGDRLYIEGKLKYREYEKDGQKHRQAGIRVDQFQLLSPPAQPTAQVNAQAAEQDDLPF